MRTLAALLAVIALAVALWPTPRPVRADGGTVLYVSGMRIAAAKPIAFVRLTNTSPNAADVFSVHYTIRDTLSGASLSTPGAGLGAQLAPGHVLELDLGKIVALYRQSLEASTFTGPVEFVAFGEGGAFRSFASDTIQVETEQHEGAAVHEGVAQWFSQ